MIREICHIQQDDGIVFAGESVEGTRIKEEDEYDGVASNFRPSWREREFRCRSISALAMPFIPNPS